MKVIIVFAQVFARIISALWLVEILKVNLRCHLLPVFAELQVAEDFSAFCLQFYFHCKLQIKMELVVGWLRANITLDGGDGNLTEDIILQENHNSLALLQVCSGDSVSEFVIMRTLDTDLDGRSHCQRLSNSAM